MNGEITRAAETLREEGLPEANASSAEAEHAASAVAGVGMHLKHAREAKKMSVVDVGRMLKLSARQLSDVELNRAMRTSPTMAAEWGSQSSSVWMTLWSF